MSLLLPVRLALLAFATPPAAEYITGANFSLYCASADWETACKTYALGLFHGSQRREATICLPDGVDMDRLYVIGIEYLRAHADRGQEAAFALILEAWERAFPCELHDGGGATPH